MNIIDSVTQKMVNLPLDKQTQILDFVEFLMVKYQQENSNKKYAEQLAIERIKDINDPTKWVTVMEIDDEIDVESSLENLRNRGYKIKIPSKTK
ncbi:MAG: DUF2281 domain-containing protein [Cyanobacteria bacterium]|nr:DUF2281 domain-containing protein [Cyanobacteria bacterium CG_2015-16_32_12]NCO78074.1 DUF2281 domain-containing protein [Cyanobacteria bacterium CG_2015-22_32_23]NCQ05141.1 DUF2281 domain-containing protein [Cyanobacteria bacterium CG_2015-09_32_10]NCQ43274.1 DUF2281 domain-containing protein [Cyanobacteria bacterium CG_2015-04_32_10]NCS83827.1 DUF2281 domain-containing protein [Cyanobacteria bacterium CG_2015-02_32_10]